MCRAPDIEVVGQRFTLTVGERVRGIGTAMRLSGQHSDPGSELRIAVELRRTAFEERQEVVSDQERELLGPER
jgi:hypothetical protein